MVGLPKGRGVRLLLMLGGGLSLGALLGSFLKSPGAIPLAEQRVSIRANPDQVYQQLSSFGQGPRIIEQRDDQVIAEFPIRVGRYQVTTLERITLDPNRRRLEFEQLRSPFFSLRTATESFVLTPGPDEGTLLTVSGVLWPRLGMFGWLVTRWLVRPRWDQIEANHLEQLRRRLEASAG